jgi:hypothetical protein
MQQGSRSVATRLEIGMGRFAATCAHPYATWRTRTTRDRVGVLLAYATTGFVAALTSLLVW